MKTAQSRSNSPKMDIFRRSTQQIHAKLIMENKVRAALRLADNSGLLLPRQLHCFWWFQHHPETILEVLLKKHPLKKPLSIFTPGTLTTKPHYILFDQPVRLPSFHCQVDLVLLCEFEWPLCGLLPHCPRQMPWCTANQDWRNGLTHHKKSNRNYHQRWHPSCCWPSPSVHRHLAGCEVAVHAMQLMFKSPETEAAILVKAPMPTHSTNKQPSEIITTFALTL